MDQVTPGADQQLAAPFNGAVEIGLRALSVLTAAYPSLYSLQRLVIFDYLVVHSDDMPNGPTGLHPQTPYRGAEILVRRGVIQEGLLLYQSRGLIDRSYEDGGVYFSATDRSAAFLDALDSEYVRDLRGRANWVVESFGGLGETQLDDIVREHIGQWGAEFALESVLWTKDAE
jgi:hypothetical protein